MSADEIIKEAFNRAGLKYDGEATIESVKDELSNIKEIYNNHKDIISDYEHEIELIKSKAAKEIDIYNDKIKAVNEADDENFNYKEHRENILHQVNVIEYEILNPNLKIR